jgi:hypothetical protein
LEITRLHSFISSFLGIHKGEPDIYIGFSKAVWVFKSEEPFRYLSWWVFKSEEPFRYLSWWVFKSEEPFRYISWWVFKSKEPFRYLSWWGVWEGVFRDTQRRTPGRSSLFQILQHKI